MTTRAFIVTVDDDDRDQCPDKPWSATITDTDGNPLGADAAGLGATLVAAVTDAFYTNALDQEV